MSDPRPSPTVSVVIITAGRRQCLPPCMESLRRQTYQPMEVVVVVGPSKDGSAGYASTLTDAKVCHVDKLNVAYARNEGIRRSGGEIIAFIDDDAVAHPRWVAEMVETFDREGPTCGGVGGRVINENDLGRPVQAFNNVINDLGQPDEIRLAPATHNDPEGTVFNYYMGANMAFRREALLAVGGFDETYFYLYEDADMSVSVIKAGYRIVHHARAMVHHFPAISHNRKSRYEVNYFAISRQQLYFSLKFSKRKASECLWGVAKSYNIWLQIWTRQLREKKMTPRMVARFAGMALKGIRAGMKEGLRYRKVGRDRVLAVDLPRSDFKPLASAPIMTEASASARRGLRIALLCGEFGGEVFGGVGEYTKHLAESLGSRGNDVTVIRSGHGPCRIIPEGYKIVNIPPSENPSLYRTSFHLALRKLAEEEDFDIVEAPLWNGEGVSVGIADCWPLVVRLVTPFELTRQISGIPLNPGLVELIAAERLELAYASGIISISRAVVDTVEQTYEIPAETNGRRLAVIPLGMPSATRLVRKPIEAPDAGGVKYLFVGRMEARKGILELGKAFAKVAKADPTASLWVVGADNSRCDGFYDRTGTDYRGAMVAMWGKKIASRVCFLGKISDEQKNDLFARCDVLVAPSMYESFGIIFLEAMRYGKPVIGTNVGGIPEVVADGETGLLVPSEDADSLAKAMTRLGSSPQLRREMGSKALRRFESLFSLYPQGRQTENFYRQVLEDWHGRSFHAPRRVSEVEPVASLPAEGRSASAA